jgi:hypothetical protein
MIFQEAGYSENSTISLSLSREAVQLFHAAIQIRGLEMTAVMAIKLFP